MVTGETPRLTNRLQDLYRSFHFISLLHLNPSIHFHSLVLEITIKNNKSVNIKHLRFGCKGEHQDSGNMFNLSH